MLTEFQEHIENNFPELSHGKSLLALSGGVDSMVLFYLMQLCRLDFDVAHCNFQLRGKDADMDEHFTKQIAGKYNRTYHSKRFDTEKYAEKQGISIQMAAREQRYGWFREVMAGENIPYLVTAHHADDNLETFLINLSRGSGLKGLTGIPAKSNDIFRPLLPFDREEILDYAQKNDITWREDLSNLEVKYLRNSIRKDLVPVMKKVMPGFMDAFRQSIHHLKDSRKLIEDRLEAINRQIVTIDPESPGIKKFDIGAILKLSDPKAYLYPLFSPYGFSQWEDIYGLMKGQSGKMVYSETHRLIHDRSHLLLQRLLEDNGAEKLFFSEDIQELLLPGGPNRLLMESCDPDQCKVASSDDKTKIFIDEDCLQDPLYVRKWKYGDYFYPKGMTGRKKLSKFFKDEKLSIPQKENIWLLCAGNEIVWIIGHRADRRFALTDQSRKVLKFEIEKLL